MFCRVYVQIVAIDKRGLRTPLMFCCQTERNFGQYVVVISLLMMISLAAWSSVIILDSTNNTKTVAVDHVFLHRHVPFPQRLLPCRQ